MYRIYRSWPQPVPVTPAIEASISPNLLGISPLQRISTGVYRISTKGSFKWSSVGPPHVIPCCLFLTWSDLGQSGLYLYVCARADPKRAASSARASAVSAASSAGGWTSQRWTSPTTKTWRTGERASKRAMLCVCCAVAAVLIFRNLSFKM